MLTCWLQFIVLFCSFQTRCVFIFNPFGQDKKVMTFEDLCNAVCKAWGGMYDRDWHLFVKFVGKVSHFANIRDMYGKRLSSMTNLGISDESNSDQSDYESSELYWLFRWNDLSMHWGSVFLGVKSTLLFTQNFCWTATFFSFVFGVFQMLASLANFLQCNASEVREIKRGGLRAIFFLLVED